jgi:hypothetical protein
VRGYCCLRPIRARAHAHTDMSPPGGDATAGARMLSLSQNPDPTKGGEEEGGNGKRQRQREGLTHRSAQWEGWAYVVPPWDTPRFGTCFGTKGYAHGGSLQLVGGNSARRHSRDGTYCIVLVSARGRAPA